MKNSYKAIDITLSAPLAAEEQAAIKKIFSIFREDNITFSLSGNIFKILLNSLDFDLFRKVVEEETREHITDNIPLLLNQAVEKIAQIGSYGIRGKKRIFAGYKEERKVKGRKVKEENRNRYYYARDAMFPEIDNPFPPEYENRIVCGDSAVILKQLPENCVDLVFTSPPYNFGLEYGKQEDAHYWEDYFSRLFSIFDECIRVLKYGGRIIVNIQPLFSDYIPSHHIISSYFMEKKLIWKGEILWEKNNYNCKYTAWGSWKSPGNPYLKYTWEFLEIFAKGNLKKEGAKENADITADEFKKWVVSKWSIAPEKGMKEYNHPAMFPVELALRVLKLFSFRQDLILDPFNGAGTTTYVAHITNRKYLGIDISEEYCGKAGERISRASSVSSYTVNQVV